MTIITDTREQQPLEFPTVLGVELKVEGLPVGDYGAEHGEVPDLSVIERKSIPDLFSSYTSGYEQERNKMKKAAGMNLTFILAIEGTATEVMKGHSYWKAGEVHDSHKTGMAMIRQLMTIQRKYGISVWFCTTRKEMAWRIQEYFLAQDRLLCQGEG